MRSLVRRLTRRWRLATAVLAVLAIFVAGSRFVLQTVATPAYQVVQKEDFGSWRYSATLEKDGWTSADITYGSSPAELKAFIAANRQIGRDLSAMKEKPFHAIVTFWTPMSLAEFQRLVTDAGISPDRVSDYTMRAVSAQDKWWIQGAPTARGLVDETAVNRGLADVRRHDPSTELLGVVYFAGSLTPNEYQRLFGDDRVALVDVAHNVVRDRLSGVKGVNLKRMSIPTGSPYAIIERAGREALSIREAAAAWMRRHLLVHAVALGRLEG